MSDEAASQALRDEIAAHRWYHTIELAPGVVTPGWFDTRAVLDVVDLPVSLEGKRCLDCGTFDGFWAFEMEKRGAAEVVAIDVIDPRQCDWPYGSTEEVLAALDTMKAGGVGFDLAAKMLGSSVKRVELSVYDLAPEEIGQFDFVYVGSLLLHLRDPVRAIERVRAVTKESAMFVDAIDLELSLLMPGRPAANFDGIGRPWWWKPNTAAFARMITSGGFDVVRGPRRFFMKPGAGQSTDRPPLRVLRSRLGREAAVIAKWGDPHAAVLARPR